MTKIKSIDETTAYEWLENNEAVVIDVREPYEYQEVRIKGSYLIPLATVAKSTLPSIERHKKMVIYCKLGKRGSMACEKLLSEDENLDVYNLEGGIIAWENAGYRIEK